MGCGSTGACGCGPGRACGGWEAWSRGAREVTVFANNQELTMAGPGEAVIYTDPVPLGDSDRATVAFNVHYLWVTGTGTPVADVGYEAQVSIDGVHWVTAFGDSVASGDAPKVSTTTDEVHGAFVRFKLALNNGFDLAGTCIDLHVKLDHA